MSLPFLVVSLMCQVDWATGCQDTWLKVILDVSVRVFS